MTLQKDGQPSRKSSKCPFENKVKQTFQMWSWTESYMRCPLCPGAIWDLLNQTPRGRIWEFDFLAKCQLILIQTMSEKYFNKQWFQQWSWSVFTALGKKLCVWRNLNFLKWKTNGYIFKLLIPSTSTTESLPHSKIVQSAKYSMANKRVEILALL